MTAFLVYKDFINEIFLYNIFFFNSLSPIEFELVDKSLFIDLFIFFSLFFSYILCIALKLRGKEERKNKRMEKKKNYNTQSEFYDYLVILNSLYCFCFIMHNTFIHTYIITYISIT